MLTALSNFAEGIVLGPQRRKVKRYLNDATRDSVSEDLEKLLSSHLGKFRELELLQKTFYKYCNPGSFQEDYWNEDCFKKYIRSTHSNVIISDPAVQLLWRSFHFYAYHPFPRDPQNGKVEIAAFEHAARLLVFRHNDLLGTRELDYFWRNDDSFFHRASFKRVFRSIGVLETATQLSKQQTQQQNDINSELSDTMDVLIMIGPQFIHAAPSSEQLEIVARKLFAKEPFIKQRKVKRKEISILMSLLLRIRLKKEKWGSWGSYYNLGDFAEANLVDKTLTEVLVNSLMGNESDQTITSEQLLKAMDLIPNLQLKFYQLWAVLFQHPVATTTDVKPFQDSETTSTYINGAISLFAPPVMTRTHRYQITTQIDERLVLEKAQVSLDSQDTTIVRLVQTISNYPSAYVVLFSSNAASTTPKTIIGACFPGPLYINSTEVEDKKRMTRANISHLLFQLQPKFRLLRWTKPDMPLTALINTKGDKITLAEVATREGPEQLNVPYWIGHPTGQGASIRIDPQKKTATLASVDEQWYREVGAEGNNGLRKNWAVVIQDARMDIFTATGGVDQEVQTGRTAEAEDTPERVLYDLEPENEGPRVEGEDLRERIQGFGSS